MLTPSMATRDTTIRRNITPPVICSRGRTFQADIVQQRDTHDELRLHVIGHQKRGSKKKSARERSFSTAMDAPAELHIAPILSAYLVQGVADLAERVVLHRFHPQKGVTKRYQGQFGPAGGRPAGRTVANRPVLSSTHDRNRSVPSTFCCCKWIRISSTRSPGNASSNKARYAEARLAGSVPSPRYSGCGASSGSGRPSALAP